MLLQVIRFVFELLLPVKKLWRELLGSYFEDFISNGHFVDYVHAVGYYPEVSVLAVEE